MSEARLVAAETGGLAPESEGWFVLNAKDARWLDGDLGAYCAFEGKEARFPQLGINLNALQPEVPMTMYHRENAQEDFLVLAVGARTGDEDDGLVYPADPVAQKHGAAVAVETSVPEEAYRQFESVWGSYREGWLPG